MNYEQQKKRVGYWSRKDQYSEPGLPWPGDTVDDNWNQTERSLVIAYLKNGKEGNSYRGYSRCRLCGVNNGSRDYYDDVYVWPEGFVHYLVQHNVKPPQEFIDHVMANHDKV